MNLDFYSIYYPQRDGPSAEDIRETLERGFDAGWSTTREGGVSTCSYSDPTNERYSVVESTDEAIEGLVSRDGRITIFPRDPDMDFDFKVHDSWSEYGLSDLGGISLTWPRTLFRSDAEIAARELFDTARLVYESVSPPFAFSYLPLEIERETAVTRDHVERGTIPDVFWTMFLSKPICEELGRDRLQSAPVWKRESLEDGGIGLVVTSDPTHYDSEEKTKLRDHLGIE